ncbi:hypothetical protein C8R47DRAFT_1251916 [Mycena vitilis]|nr:hypothetical protein C8R47DRAFT_1251916 [Mycena vitilis]
MERAMPLATNLSSLFFEGGELSQGFITRFQPKTSMLSESYYPLTAAAHFRVLLQYYDALPALFTPLYSTARKCINAGLLDALSSASFPACKPTLTHPTPTYLNTMIFSLSIVVSAALALFSATVSAMPSPGSRELRARNDCVAGNFFDGTDCTPCPVGTYQPYPGQVFCYGAPSGRFQGLEGQAGVCGACCGWETTPGQVNNNTLIVKCEASTPFSGLASGSGCVETRQGCDPVDTCEQAVDGTCPAQTFY